MTNQTDKRKIIVVAALAVAVLSVGAFQFIGGGPPPPAPAKKKSTVAQDQAKEDQAKQLEVEKLVAGVLPQRDPFTPAVLPIDPAAKPVDPKQPEPPKPNASRNRGGTNRFATGGGPMPPMDPMGGLPSPTGEIGIQPGGTLRQPGESGLTVSGTVTGDHPVAVLRDENGNQRVVALGGQIDPDTKVVGIEKGKVTIERKGKRHTLSPTGGNPSG